MGPLVLTEVLFDEKIREQIRKYRRHFLRVSSPVSCTQTNSCWVGFLYRLLGMGLDCLVLWLSISFVF